MKTSVLLNTLAAAQLSYGAYVVQDDYSADKFFDMFDMFTEADPTHGFVKFVDLDHAKSKGMISVTNNTVRMAADSKNKAPGGRESIRITSKAAYDEGLIVLDLAHMPGSICGTWPAFWTLGPDWPANGEIDIIEGVNQQAANQMTLHTAQNPYCGISGNEFTGKTVTTNCFVHAGGQANNAGCAISATHEGTYGDDFNQAGGGIYATHWTPQAIQIYHWTRGNIPADVAAGAPNPASWGNPAAQWTSNSCNIGASFKKHNLVFDLTFCGEWAGDVWGSSSCKAKAGTCNDFVANNPEAFEDAYWIVNSLKVYQDDGKAYQGPPASAAPKASSAAASGAAPSAAPSAAASSGGDDAVVTVTITQTTLLSIPYPQTTGGAPAAAPAAASSGGAAILSDALPGTQAKMFGEQAMATDAAELAARHLRHHHHGRGLHGHMH